MHTWGDLSKVLSDEGEVTECLMDRREERRTWTWHPASTERGSGFPRHLPVSGKTPEVVESYVVYQRKRAANALDPPGIARLLEDIPAVEGVAPELAGGAEVIGWDSGHNQGPPPLVKREELWMRPDVSAVVRDEDRQV